MVVGLVRQCLQSLLMNVVPLLVSRESRVNRRTREAMGGLPDWCRVL